MKQETLRRNDYYLIAGFCVVLYTFVLSVGGPLTMHEGVLSQTSRQMAADQDWLIPKFGQAPWLERPPLPQWITVAITSVAGRTDQEWAMRIGPAVSATLAVLLTGWLGGQLFGRVLGILAALVLATMYNFVRYATLAEADMFLCPIVTGALCVFAYLEFIRPKQLGPDAPRESINPFGPRPWPVLGFFALLGMTNLAKGLVFGTAMTLIPIGGYLLLNFDVRAILRYVWVWGILLTAAIAVAWPIAVYQRFPDALELWHFDLFGRLHGGYLAEPAWYYFGHWFWVVAPWPISGLIGMITVGRTAITKRYAPERFLLCWALLTPAVFSLSQGKHHHYMLHFLPPWGILCAMGVRGLWQLGQTWPLWVRRPLVGPVVLSIAADLAIWFGSPHIRGPEWTVPAIMVVLPMIITLAWWIGFHSQGGVALTGGFGLLMTFVCLSFAFKGSFMHRSTEDTAFLREAREMVPRDKPFLVLAHEDALAGLRTLYYCPDNAILLHNLSFLRDQRIESSDVYLIARGREFSKISKYGKADVLLRSVKSRREEGPEGRWTLFQVHLREDLERKPGGVRISPMQAMYREEGPDLDR